MAAVQEEDLDSRGHPARSALDTYERGSCKPAFGLVAVDHDTFERIPEPSAVWLGNLGRIRVPPR